MIGVELTPEQVWTQFHSYSFDFSVWEIWGALLHGGRLVVVPDAVARSADDFHALLVSEQVTVLTQTPSAAAVLSNAGPAIDGAGNRRRTLPARAGGSLGAGPGDGQRVRPDRDDDVGLQEHTADSGVGGTPDRFADRRGGVFCAGRVVAAGAGGCGR